MSVRTESVSSHTRTRGEVRELTRRRRAPAPPGPPASGPLLPPGTLMALMVGPRLRSWVRTAPMGRTAVQAMVPPAGFEPALSPPEGDALSPELRGLGADTGYQPGTGRPNQTVTARRRTPSARPPGDCRRAAPRRD